MDVVTTEEFQYGDIVYTDPYLINKRTNTDCKVSPNIGRFIKLLCQHYPEQVTRQQVIEYLDPYRTWAADTNTGSVVHYARTAFKAIGCERSISTIYSRGYRLLVPVMITEHKSPLIIYSDDISLLKELLNTHPHPAARGLVEKLGIRE